MLASITPLGERGRHNRYATTAAWFACGSAAGGAVAGAIVGAAGAAVRMVFVPSPTYIALAVALVALAGAVAEAGLFGIRVPTTKRQVDERWMDRFRGWVYGSGWGFQLGLGFVTVVNSAAVYVAFGCALLAGSVVGGAAVGLAFGLARGLLVYLSAPIRTPTDLRTFHQRFDHRQPAVVRAAVAALLLVGAAALTAGFAA